MTYICCSTVLVVGEYVDNQSTAAWTVTLVGHLLVIAVTGCTHTLINSTLDVILWNVVCLCLGESQLQSHVTGRVSTAHTNSDSNLTANLGSNLTANSIICTLFTLNICPL